jgi:hypothetical protein
MIALGLLGFTVVMWVGVTFLRRRHPGAFRQIDAYARLNRSVGLAVENGTRLHISLGRGSLFTIRGASALAGLAMVRQLTERTSLSDRPPVVTSGNAPLAILSQDTLQSGYRGAGAEEQYRFSTGRLTGLTPFSYAAGTIPIMQDEEVSANVFIGDFGAESALLADAAERENSILIAASDNLAAQSVFYATSQEPLVAEELYAAGAYVGAGAAHDASLTVQDILRWLVIAAIIVGSLLKFVGVI